ncbi:hypothetical protein [Kitasatospora purpeofusca]
MTAFHVVLPEPWWVWVFVSILLTYRDHLRVRIQIGRSRRLM